MAVPVVDEKADRAGELVGLLRHDPHRELLTRQARRGILKAFRGVCFLDVYEGGPYLGASLTHSRPVDGGVQVWGRRLEGHRSGYLDSAHYPPTGDILGWWSPPPLLPQPLRTRWSSG